MKDITNRVLTLLKQRVLNGKCYGMYVTPQDVKEVMEIVLRKYDVKEKKK